MRRAKQILQNISYYRLSGYRYPLLADKQRHLFKSGKKGKKVPAIDLSRAQLFACVHHDSKSGIPHLHILVNRIDLDGNLMTNRFIGNRCTMAAHTINVEEGWELPEDIHKANVNEITDACYKVLSEMRAYSWNDYVDRIKALGYDVKV